MAKRNSRVQSLSTRIPINTLSGGVGRQAPSKRLPTEAQNIDNALVTLEKSISKRSGWQLIGSNISNWKRGWTFDIDPSNKDLWFTWFDIAENARYLIIIDYNATSESQQLLWVFRVINSESTTATKWLDISPPNQDIPLSVREYITFGTGSARQNLKAISVGQNLIILNRKVKAGFTSDTTGPAVDEGLIDGTEESSLANFILRNNGHNTGYDGDLSYETFAVTGNGTGFVCSFQVVNGAPEWIKGVSSVGDGYKVGDVLGILDEDGNEKDNRITLLNPPNYLFNFSGERSNVIDLKGRQIEYSTVIPQDPLANASEWNKYEDYIAGDEVIHGSTTSNRRIYQAKNTISGGDSQSAPANTGNWRFRPDSDGGSHPSFIPVEDWIYPRSSTPELGQSLADFSKIPFPPKANDMIANNGKNLATSGVDRTEETLAALYPNIGSPDGRGKIYFAAASYLSALPGYYRIISDSEINGGQGRPYTQRVRTPDANSVFDAKRFPQRLSLVDENIFKFNEINWSTRTTGTKESNPGPAIFTKEDKSSRQVAINSMAFYRGRLFLSAEDTLFSSRIGEFNNLWIANPSNIVSTDPLDLQASSNKYSRINAMIPFADYLFINTDSDTQFELMGSENQITPFTAELAPTAFYSTSPMVDPILMGSQIYFFSPNKMYLYFSTGTANLNNAVEVSSHCPDYLPSNFGTVGTAPSRDTVFFVDEDNKNHLYMYVNRFSGDQVVQNAFHRWTLDSSYSILSASFFDDYIYAVVSYPENDVSHNVKLIKCLLNEEDLLVPRIDGRYQLQILNEFITDVNNVNYYPATYNTTTDRTTFYLPHTDVFDSSHKIDNIILSKGFGDREYERLNILSNTNVTIETDTETFNWTAIDVAGNYSYDIHPDKYIYFGRKYTMNVEMSPIFYRDDQNNVVNGVLNLRTMHTRHFNTGSYDIAVSRRGRSETVTTFNVMQLGTLNQTLNDWKLVEDQGELTSKVYGYASETTIFIRSSDPTPCNITNIELRGKFKPVYSSVLD